MQRLSHDLQDSVPARKDRNRWLLAAAHFSFGQTAFFGEADMIFRSLANLWLFSQLWANPYQSRLVIAIVWNFIQPTISSKRCNHPTSSFNVFIRLSLTYHRLKSTSDIILISEVLGAWHIQLESQFSVECANTFARMSVRSSSQPVKGLCRMADALVAPRHNISCTSLFGLLRRRCPSPMVRTGWSLLYLVVSSRTSDQYRKHKKLVYLAPLTSDVPLYLKKFKYALPV